MVPNSPHQRFCHDDDDDYDYYDDYDDDEDDYDDDEDDYDDDEDDNDDDEDDNDDAWDNDVVDVAGDGGGAAEPTNAFAIATIPNITDVITAQILEIIDSE